ISWLMVMNIKLSFIDFQSQRNQVEEKKNLSFEKLCIIWKRPAIDRKARIRIVKVKMSSISDHSHSMEENDMRKRSNLLK
ncbi:13202_t:CDS:2, partial [Racocetra persica]